MKVKWMVEVTIMGQSYSEPIEAYTVDGSKCSPIVICDENGDTVYLAGIDKENYLIKAAIPYHPRYVNQWVYTPEREAGYDRKDGKKHMGYISYPAAAYGWDDNNSHARSWHVWATID